MKKVLSLILTVIMIMFSLCACSKSEGKDYFQQINKFSFWENDINTSVPQYKVYKHFAAFLSNGEIKDGNVISSDGKIKKVLFLGFDGMRADALPNIIFDGNNFETNGYNEGSTYSGINEILKEGGIYLAYCGGEKGTDTQQSTSTSASWTSQFTGVWGNQHGIQENEQSKNMEYKTFMLDYAEKGLQTSIAFDWGQYFDINLKEEIKYVMNNPQIQMTFCDIDREVASEVTEDSYAESLELYNFVAAKSPSESEPYDKGIKDYVLERIASGDDIVCGIFHNIDANGHTYEFSNSCDHYVNSVRNCDQYAYDIVQAVKEREKNYNEQWLIVISNDHGGIEQGHGKQTPEERTTWIASNIKLDEGYYSIGYNGYKLK